MSRADADSRLPLISATDADQHNGHKTYGSAEVGADSLRKSGTRPAALLSDSGEQAPAAGEQEYHLEYKNLTYNVDQKTILDGVSGRAWPGKLLGIMGPSGAGKTTLLHCLSGRRMAGQLAGEVTVNANPVNKDLMQRISAFVEQLDVLFGSSTPREALLFASRLRLDPAIPDDKLLERVDELIEELGLGKCKNSLIGYVGEAAKNSGLKRGLSGGERKRLSIGFELISEPLLIFLDEPTTGLDSFAANSVIRTLRRLAIRQNRTIIFTIHQPSDEIFELLDYVHTLALGKTIYYGERERLVGYFQEIERPCPPLSIIPDHLIDIIFGDDLERNKGSYLEMDPNKRDVNAFMEQARQLSSKYKNSSVWQEIEKIASAEHTDLSVTEGRHGKASFKRQFQVLSERAWKDALREPRQLRSWVGQAIFMGLFLGLIYFQLDYNQINVGDRMGCLFMCMTLMFMTSFNSPINLFPAERAIFLHEFRQGLYDTLPYFLAKLTTEVAQIILKPFLFASCSYWLINFNNDPSRFFTHIFGLFSISYCVYSLALMLSSGISEVAAVLAIMPMIFIPTIVTSGFLVNLDTISPALSWLQHVSFMKYGLRAMVNNEFSGVNITCTEEEKIIFNCACPYETGEDVLEEYAMNGYSKFTDISIVCAIGATFNVMAYILLNRSGRKNV